MTFSDVFQSVLLAFVQGVSEFLPLSSSGHLVLVSHFFHMQSMNLFFVLVLHVGSLMAVFSYYKKELVTLGRGGFAAARPFKSPPFRLLCLTGVALLPSVSMGVFLKPVIEKSLTSPLWAGAGFLLTGLCLIFAGKPLKKQPEEQENPLESTDLISQTSQGIRIQTAFLVGTAQVLAFFPGMSRAGWTICMALFLGVRKKQAVFFSFLLAVPTILGAMFFELLSSQEAPPFPAFISLTLALLCSWFFGFLALKILVRSLEKLSFPYFALYLCPLGVFILLAEGTKVFSP